MSGAGPMLEETAPFGGLYFSIHSENSSETRTKRPPIPDSVRFFPLSDGSGYFLSPTWVRARDALIGSNLTVGPEVPDPSGPDGEFSGERLLMFRLDGLTVAELRLSPGHREEERLCVSDFKRNP